MVPWLVFNSVIIFTMLLVFTAWTFISFFISILLAIIFPVLAGLVLGIWILLWKKIYQIHAKFHRIHGKMHIQKHHQRFRSGPDYRSRRHMPPHLITIPEKL